MSFLRGSESNLTQVNNQSEPSPTNQKNLRNSARNPEISMNGSTDCQFVKNCFVERISLFTSSGRKADKGRRTLHGLTAGMTVEASILLPLFLFFFLNMGCAIELIRFHGNMQLALWQVGSEISLYGYVLDSGEIPEEQNGEQDGWEGLKYWEEQMTQEGWNKEQEGEENSWWKELAGIVFSSTYIKWQLAERMGRDYIDQSPLTKGVDSLHLWESEIFGSGDEIDIVVTYSVSPWNRFTGFVPFRMANRYYSHIWNGYQLPGQPTEEVKTVFLTENGTVYHVSRDCTYIKLKIRQIHAKELQWIKNYYGSTYEPCTKCTKGPYPTEVYITEKGNSYHYNKGCSALKRIVHAVPLKEAANYQPCSRCGK